MENISTILSRRDSQFLFVTRDLVFAVFADFRL